MIFFHFTLQAGPLDGESGVGNFAERQQALANWWWSNMSGSHYVPQRYVAGYAAGKKSEVSNWASSLDNVYRSIFIPGGSSDDNNSIHLAWRRGMIQRLYYLTKDDSQISSSAKANLKEKSLYFSLGEEGGIGRTKLTYAQLDNYDWHNRTIAYMKECYQSCEIDGRENDLYQNLTHNFLMLAKRVLEKYWYGGNIIHRFILLAI
jgi:hypothetical protein